MIDLNKKVPTSQYYADNLLHDLDFMLKAHPEKLRGPLISINPFWVSCPTCAEARKNEPSNWQKLRKLIFRRSR